MMNNSLTTRKLVPENTNSEHYFRYLLQASHDAGLLNGQDIERIQLQSVEILALQVKHYTKGESSSIRVEAAQNIMQSILYTITLYLQSLTTEDKAVTELREKPLDQIYQKGQELIRQQFNVAKGLYFSARQNSITTPHIAYNDTLGQGLNTFFLSYDIEFAAQETPADIDYPLSVDITDQNGITYILSYLRALYQENQFCRKFSAYDIDCLLHGHSKEYQDLLLNIFDEVLACALGCILSDKDVFRLDLTTQDIAYLQVKLTSTTNMEDMLKKTAAELFNKLAVSDQALQAYILQAVAKLLPSVAAARERQNAAAIFTIPAREKSGPYVYFTDKVKMPDEDFRVFTEELRSCRTTQDKLIMIQKLQSLEDMTDMLGAGCLFGNELADFFTLQTDETLALLLNKIWPWESDSPHLSAYEKEWQSAFNTFLQKIPPAQFKRIQNIAANIKIQ